MQHLSSIPNMKNLYSLKNLKTKILAYIDFTLGVLMASGIIYGIYTLKHDNDWQITGTSTIAIYGPLLAISSIFNFLSFKYLQKNKLKGIKISLIPKITFLIVNLIYLFASPSSIFLLIIINFLLILLIGLTYSAKEQLIKPFTLRNTSNKIQNVNDSIGNLWLLIPTIVTILVTIFYTMIELIPHNLEINIKSVMEAIFMYAPIFSVIIAFELIPIAIVIAVIQLIKKNKKISKIKKKNISNTYTEMQKWNWGAAGLTWIWGIYYNLWITLAILIPALITPTRIELFIMPLNIFLMVNMGVNGNEWAWHKNKQQNIDGYITSQKKWKYFGMLSFIFLIFYNAYHFNKIFQ